MELRPYQQEVARAIFDSILQGKGLTFSVEIARQGGKNELSAHIEVLLLTMFIAKGGTSIKCSPTFKPQTLISMNRLKDRLDDFGFDGIWQAEYGYIMRLGSARQVFLSADESSNGGGFLLRGHCEPMGRGNLSHQAGCFVAALLAKTGKSTTLAKTFLEGFSLPVLRKLLSISKGSHDGFPGEGHDPAVAVNFIGQVILLDKAVPVGRD